MDDNKFHQIRVGDNVIEVLDDEEQEFDIEKIDFHEEFGVGPYLNNDIAVVHINRSSGGIKFGNKVGPACLPPKDLVLNPAINLTVSGWGKNGYDAAQRQGGTNFVSKLNMAVVPVIERGACKEEKVYGPEKISLGMFCAGDFEKCPKNISNENLPDRSSRGRSRHVPRRQRRSRSCVPPTVQVPRDQSHPGRADKLGVRLWEAEQAWGVHTGL